jgi:hypothetical protein
MSSLFKKTVLATVLAATALAGAAPAMAHDEYGGYHHDGGDGAGLAIGAGILGLAVGAIIASDHHHRDNGYYANGYYDDPYARQEWVWRDGSYWDRNGNRYNGDGRGYGNDYRGYARRGYGEYGYSANRYGYRGGNNGYRGGDHEYGERRGY